MEIVLDAPAVRHQKNKLLIPVGVSNRHVHLAQKDLVVLFGETYQLKPLKQLSQPGEFASREVVSLVGPKGVIEGVRIIGPCREQTQVEISMTDSYRLGVQAPVRISGQLEGTPGLVLVGPRGILSLKEGVIVAARHIHMPEEMALHWNLKHGGTVRVHFEGVRAVTWEKVAIRVSKHFQPELHVDTDEANSALLRNGDQVRLII